MKCIYFSKTFLLAAIACVAVGTLNATWCKPLPNGTSVVFDRKEHTLKIFQNHDESDVCIFGINNIATAVIHPEKTAIMTYGSDNDLSFKTIINQNGQWREIATPVIPEDPRCIGTRYQGTSCSYRLLRGCKIFIIMLPHGVQIFEYNNFAWSELCIIQDAQEIISVKNSTDNEVVIVAEFGDNRNKRKKSFIFDREDRIVKKEIENI